MQPSVGTGKAGRRKKGGRFFDFFPCGEALLVGSGFLGCRLLGLGGLRVSAFRVPGLRGSGLRG